MLAVDEDGTTENSELWYSIPDGAAAKVFVVDSDIGRLSVKTPLDYEAGTPKRTVKVRATNVGKLLMCRRQEKYWELVPKIFLDLNSRRIFHKYF